MIAPDSILAAISLTAPPLLMITIPSKLRGFLWSVVVFWLCMIVAAQYHLAYTPDYDSIAPGLSIFIGWLPAAIYSTIWLVLIATLQYFHRTLKRAGTATTAQPLDNE